MKRVLSILIVLGLAAVSTSARADAGVEASMGFSHSLLRSDSINAVADHDSLAGSALSVDYRLGSFNGVELAVGSELTVGGIHGDVFQQIDTNLTVTRWSATIRGTYPLIDHLNAFGRLSTGAEWANLRLQNPTSSAEPIDDWSRTGTAALFGGTELSFASPDGRLVAFGLRLEVGYTRSMSHTFAGQPAELDDDTIEISTVAAQLGDVNTSGWGYRISVAVKF